MCRYIPGYQDVKELANGWFTFSRLRKQIDAVRAQLGTKGSSWHKLVHLAIFQIVRTMLDGEQAGDALYRSSLRRRALN